MITVCELEQVSSKSGFEKGKRGDVWDVRWE